MSEQSFTVVFDGDIRKLSFNPLRAETAYGRPIASGIGDALTARDDLLAALKWFADPDNWREEQLSDGPHFSSEWKLGFDPREMARRAVAKAESCR